MRTAHPENPCSPSGAQAGLDDGAAEMQFLVLDLAAERFTHGGEPFEAELGKGGLDAGLLVGGEEAARIARLARGDHLAEMLRDRREAQVAGAGDLRERLAGEQR